MNIFSQFQTRTVYPNYNDTDKDRPKCEKKNYLPKEIIDLISSFLFEQYCDDINPIPNRIFSNDIMKQLFHYLNQTGINTLNKNLSGRFIDQVIDSFENEGEIYHRLAEKRRIR